MSETSDPADVGEINRLVARVEELEEALEETLSELENARDDARQYEDDAAEEYTRAEDVTALVRRILKVADSVLGPRYVVSPPDPARYVDYHENLVDVQTLARMI